EKIQLQEETARLAARLQEFAATVETEKLKAQHCRGTVEERQQRLRDIQQEVNQITQQLDAALRRQAETRSRLTLLEQLDSEHEGFSAGALAALNRSQSVLGSLADRIRVADQHIPAIETALGHHLQLVLTENPEEAQQILADLNTNKSGRASIGSLRLHDGQSLTNGELADSHAASNGSLPACAVVQAEPSIQPLIQRLLGATRIVANLGAATDAWRKCNGAFDFVTQSGELLSRHGVYTGGYANGSAKAPT